MKVNILDAHDRLKHLIEDQSAVIAQGASDCLLRNPLSLALQEKSPYIYIFAHPRTDDDGVTKRLIWQPRLGIPQPQTNSYLYRAISKTDLLEVCWQIPPREMWKQYEKGKVTESNWTAWSIHQFQFNRELLERPHPDDLPEETCKKILAQVIQEHREMLVRKKLMDGLYLSQ